MFWIFLEGDTLGKVLLMFLESFTIGMVVSNTWSLGENFDGDFDADFVGDFGEDFDEDFGEDFDGDFGEGFDSDFDGDFGEGLDADFDGDFDEHFDGGILCLTSGDFCWREAILVVVVASLPVF